MTMIIKTILADNLEKFIKEILEHYDLGWKVDFKNPPGFYGYHFEAQLVAEGEDASEVKEPTTREEKLAARLAAARAAKKAKAQGLPPAPSSPVQEAPEPTVEPTVAQPEDQSSEEIKEPENLESENSDQPEEQKEE